MKQVKALVERHEGIWFAAAVEGERIKATSIGLTREGCLRMLKAKRWTKARGKEKELARAVIDVLRSIFRGEGVCREIEPNLEGLPEKSQRILRLVARIPRGYVTTYASLAGVAQTSPRAVGRILAANPFPLLIPCHRVVRSNHSLGGYTAGQDIKRKLLRNENRFVEKLREVKFQLIPVCEIEGTDLKECRRGLYVGRFQPPHKGHIKIIQDLLDRVDELIIAIGSAQVSHELDNPFTAGERISMLRLALREAGADLDRCHLIPVPDVEAHSTWVSSVLTYVPKFDVVFTNEALTTRLFKEAGFKVESIPFYRRQIYSSTEVRQRMLRGKDWEELVPPSVAEFIKEIGGVERLLELARTDRLS